MEQPISEMTDEELLAWREYCRKLYDAGKGLGKAYWQAQYEIADYEVGLRAGKKENGIT